MTTETQFGVYTQAQVDEMLAEVEERGYSAAEVEDALDTQRALCLITALLVGVCGAAVGGAIGFGLGWWLS